MLEQPLYLTSGFQVYRGPGPVVVRSVPVDDAKVIPVTDMSPGKDTDEEAEDRGPISWPKESSPKNRAKSRKRK